MVITYYNPDGNPTHEGQELCNKTEKIMKPLLEEYINKGMSIPDFMWAVNLTLGNLAILHQMEVWC